MDESTRAQARSALKAAQNTLSEGINCLQVAGTVCPPEPLAGEGESVALDRGFSEAAGGAVWSFLSGVGGFGRSYHPSICIYIGFLLSPPKPGAAGD